MFDFVMFVFTVGNAGLRSFCLHKTFNGINFFNRNLFFNALTC